LIDAFVRGAGLTPGPAWPPSTLSAAWMQHLGAVMRAGTEGTLALLRSRAATKRHIRAEETRIAPRQNNPLKFAPDATEALTRLLRQTDARGFLDPIEALRDAHDDLLIHQVAMAAGMRAALFELVSRLDPQAIESLAGPPTGLARHLPPLRDAALWHRLRERHAQLVEHLDDEFEEIFGREFVRAYEAQVRSVERRTPPTT
jgi:type VI secretion system FHA domain protein